MTIFLCSWLPIQRFHIFSVLNALNIRLILRLTFLPFLLYSSLLPVLFAFLIMLSAAIFGNFTSTSFSQITITRLVRFQPSARRGRPVLVSLTDRSFHLYGLPISSVPPVAASLLLVPPPPAPIGLPSLINHTFVSILKPEQATISIHSTILEVQPLSSPPIASGGLVIVNGLPPSLDLFDCQGPPGWVVYLGELYQLGTAILPMVAGHTSRRRDWDADANKKIF